MSADGHGAPGGALEPAVDEAELTDRLADLGEGLAAEGAWDLDRILVVAGVTLRLSVAGAALVDVLWPALAHHPNQPAGQPTDEHADPPTDQPVPVVTIRAWDSRATQRPLPQFGSWALDGGVSGAARAAADHGGRRVRARYHPDERALSAFDPARGQAWQCVADAAELPYWERGAPLRTLLHWIMEDHGRLLVHAAAVGRATGGLLVVGRGGSGKSTTALACLGRGLGYLGDDYCVVEPPSGGGPARAHSLYSSAKVVPTQLEQVPELALLASWVANPTAGDDKALLFVHEHAPEQILESFPLAAVAVPVITGGPDTTVVPSTAGAALAALAPSSVLQLPGGGGRALGVLASVTRATPAVELRLGTDLVGVVAALDGALDQFQVPAAADAATPQDSCGGPS